MNERIKQMAKPYLMYERFSRYGESTEEEYYDFLPEELKEFVRLLISEVMIVVRDEVQYEYDWALADIVTERVKKEFGV